MSDSARWEERYEKGDTPWETGQPSSELQRVAAEVPLHPCRALELGCGTGASAVWLAQQGFDVTALDLSARAIERARRRADQAGVNVRFLVGDVLSPPPELTGPFDFFFDRGCYHVVRREDVAAYLETLRRLTRPRALGLVLAGNAREPHEPGPPVVSEEQLRAELGSLFDLVRLREFRFDQVEKDGTRFLGWSCLVRRRVLLEVPVASVEDALAAQAGGADRLELNAALSLGGLTPSLGTLIEVKAAVALPVFVMIRPRPGGFAYSRADWPVMQRDADLALQHGAAGIVFGILTADGRVDGDRCRSLLRQVGNGAAVFHRAFDVTPDPFEALEQLIDLGFRRVLTSGQEETAYNGAVLIAELIRRSAGRIEVLPAGGINRFTVTDIVARTGCDQVHASLQTKQEDRSVAARPQVSFGGSVKLPEDHYSTTSPEAVAELRGLLRRSVDA